MKAPHALSLLALALGATAPQSSRAVPPTALSVDFAQPSQPLDSNLWSSSGVDQGLMTPAFAQDMQLIGSVPYGGGRWMRPHFLLNLIRVSGLDGDHPAYDWTDFDRTMDTITQAGLTPLFELMGNPSQHFTSFLEKAQVYAWKRLVADLATHLESRYGAPAVRTWLFESWNEPDINNYWKWKSPEEHQHYYDACSEGLKAADPLLKFGGPGTARTANVYGAFFQSFLNHCDRGTNYLTGETGVRLDFISFHCKNRPAAMVDTEVKNLDLLLRDHPKFATLPIFNDEADSEVQWNHPYAYRGTPWYAAFIARNVNEHLVRLQDGASLAGGVKLTYRLSNDDAFWGPWGFRSQFTQFGNDQRFAFIKKPSHTVRTALALLGNRRWTVEGSSLQQSVGALATRRADGALAILVYNYSDQVDQTGTTAVSLTLRHLPFDQARWVHYRIDADHGDTHRQWLELGSPANPTDDQIQALRDHQELTAAEPAAVVSGDTLTRQFVLPLPGVSLIIVAPDRGPAEQEISGTSCRVYPSLEGKHDDVLIQWHGLDRLVATYEVLGSDRAAGPYHRLNPSDQLETSFIDARPPGTAGYVQILAVDYWGRRVGASPPVALPRG